MRAAGALFRHVAAAPSVVRSFSTMSSASSQPAFHQFGPFKISASQVFFETPLCYASVNLKPVVPGHALVIPRRVVARVSQLTADELADMWVTAQRVAVMLEAKHATSASTFTIQDGPDAGQSVPHVHIHVLPRRRGDFAENDDVYPAIERSSDAAAAELRARAVDASLGTRARSSAEMADEALQNRSMLSSML
jgi:diadenosine tetraphosphate (Ap4A) HIT family hydrolase